MALQVSGGEGSFSLNAILMLSGQARKLCSFRWFQLDKVVRNNYVIFAPCIRFRKRENIKFYKEQDSRTARQEMKLV